MSLRELVPARHGRRRLGIRPRRGDNGSGVSPPHAGVGPQVGRFGTDTGGRRNRLTAHSPPTAGARACVASDGYGVTHAVIRAADGSSIPAETF
jgi:hypothetical protein